MSSCSREASVHLGFFRHFEGLEDTRQQKKVLYPLPEVLLLTLCAVLSGADSWVEVALFGTRKLSFLRRFLPFADGTPSHDQLGNIYAVLNDEQFQSCFIAWAETLKSQVKGVVAVDGKTLRRSYDKGGTLGPVHMVSAWSSGQRLVLGQRQVDKKSNEITAIPALLDLLSLEGAIVTIDAMGCQHKIAAKVRAKKADYLFGLKGNQGRLRDDVELFLKEQRARDFADTTVTYHETVEKEHGRLETRRVWACGDVEWLRQSHKKWASIRSIVMVEYSCETAKGPRREIRFYVSSLEPDAKVIADVIRQHWGIENGLHWVLDMIFRDDECRIRKANAPANFTTIKHMASNILRGVRGKHSMRSKRHLAAWDDDFLFQAITA
jgi:predicted transposase YbfD/YdcC